MMEPVEFKERPAVKLPEKDWAATGWDGKSRDRAIVNSLYIEADVMSEVNKRLKAKYDEIEKNEVRVQSFMTDDADYVVAAFGTIARIAKNAVLRARERGIKAGLVRPITLWPFPEDAVGKRSRQVKGRLVVEMNQGQMLEDVRMASQGRVPVRFYGTTGGIIPAPGDIVAELMKMKEGE
jgi:2-oxoglutarate ferredoxin oxidoreductase subunit alpha